MKKHEMSLALNLAGGSNSINGRSPNSLGPSGLFLGKKFNLLHAQRDVTPIIQYGCH